MLSNRDASIADVIASTRRYLDALATAGNRARPAVVAHLEQAAALLDPAADDGAWRTAAHRLDLPDRGQALTPRLRVEALDEVSLRASAWFGPHFHGSNGAAHGGAIPLLFDEAFGHVVHARGRRARTAMLTTQFRSVTPVGEELELAVEVTAEEGRKVWMRGRLARSNRLCAESEALFVELRPEQP